MKIFLIRHGEIENPKKVLYGRLPEFHLCQKGRKDISNLANRFIALKIKIEKIYTSPLERTIETADIFAHTLKINYQIENSLIDSDLKQWEGKPIKEYLNAYRNNLNFPDIEPIGKAGKRLFDVLKKIAELKQNAIVISHGDPIMGAVAIIRKDKIIKDYIGTSKFFLINIENNTWNVSKKNKFY